MPSNAMKISQLIQQLEGMRGFHGDLDCVLASAADGAIIAIDGRNVNVTGELLGQRLPQPVLIIGLYSDEAGRIRNMAGFKYETSADSGEWNYDRTQAPEDIDLIVWKRRGGADRGYREGERWYVFEGADERPRRPIEIVPDGILGWKRP